MNKLKFRKILAAKREGIALITSIFIAIVGLIVTIGMMSVSSSNTNQITDDKNGITAYYAAEAGLEEVRNLFNSNISNLGVPLTSLDLPEQNSPSILSNNASYWIDSLTYSNSNQTLLVNIVGKYKDAYRKIRAKMDTSIPDAFNEYGLLTNGVLTIHGEKTLMMNVHANGGLDFTGGTRMLNNAIASQSNDPTAGTPNSQNNAIGGYTPRIDVPAVPISDYRIKSKEDNILLNINQGDFYSQLNNAPAGSCIYISGTDRRSVLNLSGNMQGKFIFIDGEIDIEASGLTNLSDVMVVAAGPMKVNGSGSIDVVSSHPGKVDTIFASGGDITLGGSRSFNSMFWTNQTFTQNGSSLAGRVISEEAILFNGSFTLSQSNPLNNNDALDTFMNVSSWQVVPVS